MARIKVFAFVKIMASKALPLRDEMLINNEISSAYDIIIEDITVYILLVNDNNNKGPNALPWRTADITKLK